jgi:hypothetical protein
MLFWVFLWFGYLIANVVAGDKKLIFVHAIWRHGDRNPANNFPTDTGNNETTWPDGWGELTNIGAIQHFELGRTLRKRYEGLFDTNKYDSKEIYVRSTSYNRTIMSALANLAGMFPPEGTEIWNKNLSWQPIPVHSRPREIDPALWMDKPCPTADRLHDDMQKSDAVKKINADNADFFKFLEINTGIKPMSLDQMWRIFDPLNCEKKHSHNHKWPTWMNDTLFEKITTIYNLSTTFYYATPELQRFRGGLLFNEIADRMKQKSRNLTTPSRLKYYVYSAHDTTLIALMNNLGVYDGVAPSYANAIIVELYQNGNDFLVEMFKMNSTANITYPFAIPGCNPCTLDTFLSLAETRRPKNWWVDCGLRDPYADDQNMNVVVGILAAVAVIFFVMFLFVLILYLKLKQNDGHRELLLNG